MMGSGPNKDKKFVQKIMKQLKEGKKDLFIVNDKDGTPTYTHDFAKNVKLLLQKEYWGLYNMVCGGETSRLEVAQEMVKILGLKDKVQIHPVDSVYFSKEYFAERPPCERLINQKLNIRNVNIMRDWRISLNEYLENYYAGYLQE
jgi:dTDP-4-dehydrorhamnose reductase